MKSLKFTPRLVQLIITGQKTCTWRLFDDKDLKRSDELELIEKENGNVFAKAVITETWEKKLKDIDERDFEGHEKFESEEAMYADYKTYYGDRVGPESVVKVVRFDIK